MTQQEFDYQMQVWGGGADSRQPSTIRRTAGNKPQASGD